MKNNPSFVIFSALLIIALTSSASDGQPKDSVVVALSLQRAEISTKSVTSAHIYPIVTVRNNTQHDIFLYLVSQPDFEVDSTARSVKLSYAIDAIPEGMTYYEFPYPLFARISSHSSVDFYAQLANYAQLRQLAGGRWNCSARIGYLMRESDFLGFVDHGLREQIVAKQQIVDSPYVRFLLMKP